MVEKVNKRKPEKAFFFEKNLFNEKGDTLNSSKVAVFRDFS
jgi:hypothetical protein